MANYILKTGSQLLRSGNNIPTSSDDPPSPLIDLNPATWGLAGGESVPKLLDSSGNGNHYQQADSTKRGIIVANAVNTYPSFKLDGSNDYYDASVAPSVKTILAVVKATVQTQTYGTLFGSTVGTLGYFLGGGTSAGSGETAQYFDTGGANGATFGINSNTNRLWVNGTRATLKSEAIRQVYFLLLSLDVSAAVNANLYRIGAYIGTSLAAAGYFNGEYARIIGYAERLTELHRKQKEKELMTLYNL